MARRLQAEWGEKLTLHGSKFEPSMAPRGHVWTAPWQELSDVCCSIGRVRSRVRPVCAARVAAGPNAVRGLGPNPSHAFKDAL